MNNREMLKEAIADAKAVKEMAIANAKAALEEAFNPQLKSMLATKLMEMEDMDENEDSEVEENYSEGEFEELSNPIMRHGLRGDDVPERETEYMRDKGMYEEDEMDLDELLAELEKDLDENARTRAEEEGYLDGEKDEKEDLKEDARTDAEEEGYLDGEKDEKEDEEDTDTDEEINLEEMSEEDLKSFIEDVIADMVKAGELEGEMETEEEDEESDDDVEIEVEDEEEVTIDEGLLDFLKKKKEAAPSKETDPNPVIGVDYDGNYIRKDGTMAEGAKEDEMNEMKKQVDTLKKELNEINLLNAKLLYVNKIFRSKNLTESQKSKVLGAFDKANTVKEAKLVFETISESVKVNKEVVRENLGRASKSAGVARKQPIMEIDAQVSRWQKLAGIK